MSRRQLHNRLGQLKGRKRWDERAGVRVEKRGEKVTYRLLRDLVFGRNLPRTAVSRSHFDINIHH